MSNPSIKTNLDVRNVPPAQRHGMIFAAFDQLVPGEAMLLVNDHDPESLRYEIEYCHGDVFTWAAVEQGPETWQVRIGRIAACCA